MKKKAKKAPPVKKKAKVKAKAKAKAKAVKKPKKKAVKRAASSPPASKLTMSAGAGGITPRDSGPTGPNDGS
ncbi:MAG TPA: hypothetical protein VGL97_06450 [Bryobacteraceae bacterium]|jgi:hypothetical protein